MQFTVRVGFSNQLHPLVPDQDFSWVTVGDADSFTDASLTASQMVAARGAVPTSTAPWRPAVVSTVSDTVSAIRAILAITH